MGVGRRARAGCSRAVRLPTAGPSGVRVVSFEGSRRRRPERRDRYVRATRSGVRASSRACSRDRASGCEGPSRPALRLRRRSASDRAPRSRASILAAGLRSPRLAPVARARDAQDRGRRDLPLARADVPGPPECDLERGRSYVRRSDRYTARISDAAHTRDAGAPCPGEVLHRARAYASARRVRGRPDPPTRGSQSATATRSSEGSLNAWSNENEVTRAPWTRIAFGVYAGKAVASPVVTS